MSRKPSKDDLNKALKAISKQGVEHVLKKLPPRYAEGVEPARTAKAKQKIRREST